MQELWQRIAGQAAATQLLHIMMPMILERGFECFCCQALHGCRR